MSKTQFFLKLVGPLSGKIFKRVTTYRDGKLLLRLGDDAVPLAKTIDYLGVQLGWTNSSDLTLRMRLQKGRYAFASLRAWWKRSALHPRAQVDLYVSTVLPVITYGLSAVGLSYRGSRRLETEVFRQLRRITRLPSHITHISNASLLNTYNIIHPVLRVQLSCCRLWRQLAATLSEHICEAGNLTHILNMHCEHKTHWWSTVVAGMSIDKSKHPYYLSYNYLNTLIVSKSAEWFREVHHRGVTPASRERLPKQSMQAEEACTSSEHICIECGRRFDSYNQLRSHQYHSACSWHKERCTFDPQHDCGQALPICRWCGRHFHWWGALRKHISEGHCDHLHLRPAPPDPESPQCPSQEHLDLRSHCILCGRWFPLTRSLSKHLGSAHPVDYQRAKTEYLNATFTPVKNRRMCPYCLTPHSSCNLSPHIKHHCVVLLQRFAARWPNPLQIEPPGGEHASVDSHGEQGRERGKTSFVHTHRERVAFSLGSPAGAETQASSFSRAHLISCSIISSNSSNVSNQRCRDGLSRQRAEYEQEQRQRQTSQRERQRSTSWPQGRRGGSTHTGHLDLALGQVGSITSRTTPSHLQINQRDLPLRALRGQRHRSQPSRMFKGMDVNLRITSIDNKGTTSSSSSQVHSCVPIHALDRVREGDRRDHPEPVPDQEPLLRNSLGCGDGDPQAQTLGKNHEHFTDQQDSRRDEHTMSQRLHREAQDPQTHGSHRLRHNVTSSSQHEFDDHNWNADVRATTSTHGTHSLGSHRRHHEIRERPPFPIGGSSEGPCVSLTELTHDDGECEILEDPVPHAEAHSVLAPSGLCTLPLENDGTLCYLNSVADMMSWACMLSPRFRALLPAEWHLALNPLLAHDSMPLAVEDWRRQLPILIPSLHSWNNLLEGWRLGEQEDASEFLVHVLQRAPVPAFAGTMVMINTVQNPETQSFDLLNVPVPSAEAAATRANCCLNAVLDSWSRSGDLTSPRNCMLLHPPNMLLIHLLRYIYVGRIQKSRTPILIPDQVNVPSLIAGEVVSTPYICIALILHHGEDPTHGHYTCIVRSSAGRWHLDDHHLPREMSQTVAEAFASQDMYILCLARV